MGYSIDFKERTISYLEEGHTYKETSETFKISPNTINTWVKRKQSIGNLEAKKREYKSKLESNQLLEYMITNPDAYQSEIAEHFGCSAATVCRELKRLGFTRKKR